MIISTTTSRVEALTGKTSNIRLELELAGYKDFPVAFNISGTMSRQEFVAVLLAAITHGVIDQPVEEEVTEEGVTEDE